MNVVQREIDCIQEALNVVKQTAKHERNMDLAMKRILETKHLSDTIMHWYRKPSERSYNILQTPEDMEAIIELVSAFKQMEKDELYNDETYLVLSVLVKRIYNELIKYVVAK